MLTVFQRGGFCCLFPSFNQASTINGPCPLVMAPQFFPLKLPHPVQDCQHAHRPLARGQASDLSSASLLGT